MRAEIKRRPTSVKTAIARREEALDLAMHPETLSPILKKNEYRFNRARTWLKLRQVAQERARKAVEDCVAVISGQADRFIVRRRTE